MPRGFTAAWFLLFLAGIVWSCLVPARAAVGSPYDSADSRPQPPDYRIHADGSVTQRVCFNWTCASREILTFTRADMTEVARQMELCADSGFQARVQRLRIGIWQMELLAQKYEPLLANDAAINTTDQQREGRMDCVDNASNTTSYLHVLHELGLIPGWTIAPYQVRDRFSLQVHWTAVVVDSRNAESWSIDSWFRPNGYLPYVMPLAEWKRGRIAWEPPYAALNPSPLHSSQLCGR